MVLEYLPALQAGTQLVKDAQAIYREWKAGKGGAPEELEQKLERAAQQLKVAEVGAAQQLGYRICRRHWPPGIMVDESYRTDNGSLVEKRRCTACDFVMEWSTPSRSRPDRPWIDLRK